MNNFYEQEYTSYKMTNSSFFRTNCILHKLRNEIFFVQETKINLDKRKLYTKTNLKNLGDNIKNNILDTIINLIFPHKKSLNTFWAAKNAYCRAYK